MSQDPELQPGEAKPVIEDERLRSARTVTMVVYGLQAASFLLPVTALVGVIINYVKRPDLAGTWLESHCRWQIRTFWVGLAAGIAGALLLFVVVGWFILAVTAIWVIYRIVFGFLRLLDNRGMEPTA